MTVAGRTIDLRLHASRAWTAARAGVSIVAEGLGVLGWLSAAAIVAAIGTLHAAGRMHDEAAGLRAQAEAARDGARRAALARSQLPAAARGAAAGSRTAAATLALPERRPAAPVLPAAFFAQAERRGIRLGPVEYRSGRQAAGVQRVDVSLVAAGRYLPTRQWIADALATMPHAQLVELSMQRADPADAELEVRVVLAVHFGVRT